LPKAPLAPARKILMIRSFRDRILCDSLRMTKSFCRV